MTLSKPLVLLYTLPSFLKRCEITSRKKISQSKRENKNFRRQRKFKHKNKVKIEKKLTIISYSVAIAELHFCLQFLFLIKLFAFHVSGQFLKVCNVQITPGNNARGIHNKRCHVVMCGISPTKLKQMMDKRAASPGGRSQEDLR